MNFQIKNFNRNEQPTKDEYNIRIPESVTTTVIAKSPRLNNIETASSAKLTTLKNKF